MLTLIAGGEVWAPEPLGRLDVLFRQLEWLDWYVRDAKPLDGPLPRLDISDAYLPAK